MFTSRQVKHSRLRLRHARKYLRYKDDQLSSADRDQITAGMKDLREALRQRDRDRIHSTADALDKTLHRLTPVTWESHWRENCEVIYQARRLCCVSCRGLSALTLQIGRAHV